MPPQNLSPQQQAFNYLKGLCNEEFGEVHKQFLQFLMTRRYIEVPEIGEVCLEICNDIAEPHELRALKTLTPEQNDEITAPDGMHNVIQSKLDLLGMHITEITDEFARQKHYWVLISELHFSNVLLRSNSLTKDEVAMFHHWLKLMFLEYQTETDVHDPTIDDIMGADESRDKTSGELVLTKALLYAKRKNWTMQKAQKLVEKMEKQQWIRVIKGNSADGQKTKRYMLESDPAIIRLHPSIVAELEPLLKELHVPMCVICKHPVVVSRLSHTCEQCHASYHGNCMLRNVEFPAKCRGNKNKCKAMLEEDLLENFDFDRDNERIVPRRSQQTNEDMDTSMPSSSSAAAGKSSAPRRNKVRGQPFSSLRDV